MSRARVLLVAAGVVLVGLVLLWLALMVRILEISPRWEISGRTATKSFPLAGGFGLAGAIVCAIGVVVALVGLAMRSDRPPEAARSPVERR